MFIADLDGAGAEAAAAGLPGTGSMGFGCDVSKDSDVQALREAVLAACPAGIDMLINNAAKPPVTGAILTTGSTSGAMRSTSTCWGMSG